jgi:dihydroxyacetone kinase
MNNKITTNDMIFIIDTMADIIIKNEVHFCDMDSAAGDGDFGMSIAKGFKQLKAEWSTLDNSNIGAFLKSCSMIIMEYCGGASGPIWGSAFRGAAKAAGEAQEIDVSGFAEILQAAVVAIQKTGERSFGRGAVVGDKTLIDALVPAADSMSESAKAGVDLGDAMKKSAAAAVEGAEATKKIAARMGRAGTVGDRSIGHPDAGAYGIGVIFTEIAKAYTAR